MVGVEDGVCYLSIIQARELNPETTLLLQDKIDHYLAYVLDGQMALEEPRKALLPKVIRLHLQQPAQGVAEEFLAALPAHLEEEGIGFEVHIGAADA